MRPWNTFIEGDNLDVLPTLVAEFGKVDLVYIDPPYNTGNDFAYRDDIRGVAGSSRHQAWVAMMRPRLEAAREVLDERGRDLREHRRQRGGPPAAADGRGVRRGRTSWPRSWSTSTPRAASWGGGSRPATSTCSSTPGTRGETVLDASSADSVVERDFPQVDPTGRRFRHLPLRNTNKKFNPVTARTLHFPLWGDPESGLVRTAPFEGGLEIEPVFGDGKPAVWRWSRPLIDERGDDLVCRRIKGRHGERVDVFQRDWLARDVPGGRRKKLRTIWLAEEVGSTDTAVAELKEIVGHVFESPKPTGLVRRILATMPDDVLVLDFFAGSGTTGHAVALANEEDGGTRRCISVNSAEPTREGSNARAAGLLTVADITRARLRAVAADTAAASTRRP